MRAGLLRHVVTIQTQSLAANNYGERTLTWTDSYTRRASVAVASGTESPGVEQTRAERAIVVTMRYTDIDARMNRIKWDNRVFGVVAVDHADSRKIETRLTCREIVGQTP